MRAEDFVYIDFLGCFYHGMSGYIGSVGTKVSTVKIETWSGVSEVTFYNEQISKNVVNPF